MTSCEVNFDGLIGPTHHFGGLSHGNLASTKNRYAVSSPKKAALQGLQKMKLVADLGIPQAFLPPHPRPCLSYLEAKGFKGLSPSTLIAAFKDRPELLSIAYSASAMWAANAATVSPSSDCDDGRVHITPANLQTMPHRTIEAAYTTNTLRAIFHDPNHFVVHDPLMAIAAMSDEGAANHTRFCRNFDTCGVELFVYGRDRTTETESQRFPARQALGACEAIASNHGLDRQHCVFAQQSPDAINAGVFHNDVISVGNQSLHLVHQSAFVHQDQILAELADRFGPGLQQIVVRNEELSLADAVQSYFFNSQLVSLSDATMLLLCPIECSENVAANRLITELLQADNLINDFRFVDLRESMHNGGGPACLRLRVVLTEEERAALPNGMFITDDRYKQLCEWVKENYRDSLSVEDLADVNLIDEVDVAMQQLHEILGC